MTVSGKEMVSVPEAARRFDIDGVRIYELLFAGALDGGPCPDGTVVVSAESVRDYLERQPAAG